MLQKCFLWIPALFLCNGLLFGQDTIPAKNHNLKVGIYKDKNEFFSKTPSIVTPFKLVPIYKMKENKDSFIYVWKAILADSSINIEKTFGLFDGHKLYDRGGGNVFSDLEGLGRHPFSSFTPDAVPPDLSGFLLPSLTSVVSNIDRMVTKPREVIYFYNKKRKLVEATPVAMYLLLKGEKDLEAEYKKEKVKNNQVYREYLLKMNERYPL